MAGELIDFERCAPDYKSGRKRKQKAAEREWVVNNLGLREKKQLDKAARRFQVNYRQRYLPISVSCALIYTRALMGPCT